jgi:hypothetical protein
VGGMELDQAAMRLLHDLAWEYARAVALGHGVLVVDFDAEQARRGAVLLIRLDTNNKTASPFR